MEKADLPLPAIRILSKKEAARYLGIGITLLSGLPVPFIKMGRRCVYDIVDLDAWIDVYKQCEHGRVKKEDIWPKPEKESTEDLNQDSGGLQQRSQTANEYARVLGLKTVRMLKRY